MQAGRPVVSAKRYRQTGAEGRKGEVATAGKKGWSFEDAVTLALARDAMRLTRRNWPVRAQMLGS